MTTFTVSTVAARQKADPAAFTGKWKLDVAASTNPNGPPALASRGGGARSGGGGGGSAAGSGGMGGMATGSGGDGGGINATGGGSGGGALGNEERARFYAMLKILELAPADLTIAATDKDVSLGFDATKPFQHKTDGKKEDLPTGSKSFGSLEIKTKWDGAALKREIKTIDGLTVVESYVLSPEGKLIVTLELKSQIERLADAMKLPVKRVYNRQS